MIEALSSPDWEGSPMERFIHDENLKLYKQKLADPNTSDAERDTIRKLLAEEETKISSLAIVARDTKP
jgi:hypothetical protein